MKKNVKVFFSLLLTLVMAVSLLPASAFAEENEAETIVPAGETDVSAGDMEEEMPAEAEPAAEEPAAEEPAAKEPAAKEPAAGAPPLSHNEEAESGGAPPVLKGGGTRNAYSFTLQPEGGSLSPDTLRFYMHWITSFVPVRYEIRKYQGGGDWDCLANVTKEEYLSAETGYWITGEDGGGQYCVRAFYGSGSDDYVESDHITVTGSDLQFTKQPASTVFIDPDTREYRISWELNFTPQAIVIERWYNGHSVETVTTRKTSSPTGTYHFPSSTPQNTSYRILAYYYYHSDPTGEEGNGNYIWSEIFTLNAGNLHFVTAPQKEYSIDPDTLKYTISWELNFMPQTLVISKFYREEFVGRVVTLAGKSRSGSYSLPASADPACRYTLTAFYYFKELPDEEPDEGFGYDGYGVASSFTLHDDTLHFLSQPTPNVLINKETLKYDISWELNFDPEIVTIERYYNGDLDERVVSLAGKRSGTFSLPASTDQRYSFRIYAYYHYHSDPTGEEGNGNYIWSDIFNLNSSNLHFESGPPAVVYIDPVTLKFPVSWELSFYPPTLLIYHHPDGEGSETEIWRELTSTSSNFTYYISPEDADLTGSYFLQAFYYYKEVPSEPDEGFPYEGYGVTAPSFRLSADNLQFTEAPNIYDTTPEEGLTLIRWTTNFIPKKIVVFHLEDEPGTAGRVVIDGEMTSGFNNVGYWVFGPDTAPYDSEKTYYVQAFYGSEKSCSILEELSDGYGFQMSPPSGTYSVNSADYPIAWTTNFTPVKVEILRGNTVVETFTDGLNRSMTRSVPAAAGESIFRLRAYYSAWEEDFALSEPFEVTYPGPMFTLLPDSGGVTPQTPHEIHWATSFDPVRQELCCFENGEFFTLGQLTDSATALAIDWETASAHQGALFIIRAYYGEGDGDFVGTPGFSVSLRLDFNGAFIETLGNSPLFEARFYEDGQASGDYEVFSNNAAGSGHFIYVIHLPDGADDMSFEMSLIDSEGETPLRLYIENWGFGSECSLPQSLISLDREAGTVGINSTLQELRQLFRNCASSKGLENPDIFSIFFHITWKAGGLWHFHAFTARDFHLPIENEEGTWMDYDNFTLTTPLVPALEFSGKAPAVSKVNSEYYTVIATEGQLYEEDTQIYPDPFPVMEDESDNWQGYYYETGHFVDDTYVPYPITERFAHYFGSGYNKWIEAQENPAPQGPEHYIWGIAANKLTRSGRSPADTAVCLADFINSDNLDYFNSLPGLSREDWLGYYTFEDYEAGLLEDWDYPSYFLSGSVDAVLSVTFADGVVLRKTISVLGGKGDEMMNFHVTGDPWTPTPGSPDIRVYGGGLSLEGDIGIKFYLVIPDEVLEDPDAYVKLNEKKLLISEAGSELVDGETMYVFKYRVAVKEMNKDVELRVFSGDGSPLTMKKYAGGTDVTADGYHYSVQKYVSSVLKNEGAYPQELVELVKAMSDYGSKAQMQFGYETDTAKPIYNAGAIDAVDLETLTPYRREKIRTERTGISFSQLNLTLESETTTRLFFTVNEGSIDDYSFTVNGKRAVPSRSEYGWAIEIRNIAAKDLDTLYTVEVSDSQGVCLTIRCSALSYAYLVLKNADTLPQTLVELVKALYIYNQRANAYFN